MSVSKGGGGSFPEESELPGDVSDDMTRSPPPPPIPPRSLGRKTTPRPHLFTSLEAARSHVYRNQPAPSSRDASGDSTHGRVGHESGSDEQDMTELTSAFGRSLTTSAQPKEPELLSRPRTRGLTSLTLPEFDTTNWQPDDWQQVPKPLNPIRAVSSGAQSTNKLQAPSSSVDRIIDQYAHQSSSSAAQVQDAVYGSTSDVDHFTRQNDKHTDEVSGVVPTKATQTQRPEGVHGWRPRPPHRASLNIRKGMHADTPPPSFALPADPPCRPPSPFQRPDTPRPLRGGPISCVVYNERRKPLSVSDESCDDQDEALKAPNNDLKMVESATASDAESGVAQLTGPPARMHSTRRAPNTRRRSRQKALANSPGDCFSEDSDEDPFKYDIYMRPSKERVVSACLREVSDLHCESRASIYSEDGTPSKTFGHHFELVGETVSPEMQRSFNSYQVESVPRNPYHDQPMEGQEQDGQFYDPNAIQSEWEVGSPNEVKVPVQRNLFGGAKKQQQVAQPSEPRSHNQLAWEAMRRRQELEANRLTGNTDD